MAYTVNWDNATPVGATTAASDIDTELQNLKISVQERMDDLIGAGNWANDAVNPKIIDTIGPYWWGDTTSWVSTIIDGNSHTFAFTERSSVGNFTVGATGVTLDDAGTYLAWGTTSYGTGESSMGSARFQGPAILFNPVSYFVSTMIQNVSGVYEPVNAFFGSTSGMTVPTMAVFIATAGETVDFVTTVHNAAGFGPDGKLSIIRNVVFILKLS